MNRLSRLTAIALGVLVVTSIAIAGTFVQTKQYTVNNGSHFIRFDGENHQPFYPTVISLNYPTAASNTVEMFRVRGNVSNNFITASSSAMQDLTVYMPNNMYFIRGDVLRVRCSSTDTAATLTLDAEF